MSNYLFTLTITPVQSFISQARKTKDLFVGSEILSSLIREALKRFDEKDRIFPQKPDFVSNKFVIKLENRELQEIKDLGNRLEESINNQFYLIGLKTLLDMKNITIDMKLFQKYFKPQMCNFFKIFWVAIEYDNSKSYQENYRKLEQNLGAVKNLRTFTQLEQESGRKCSLCGERNGLFYSGKKPKYIIENAINIKNNQIQEGESLCSVCFTKRFYYNSNSSPYPSTAKIALLDWLKKVENRNQYEKLFNNFDESLYFKDNLSKEYLEKWGYFKNNDNLTKAIEFLDNLEIDSKQKRYYALIQFDIDDMGKKLSSLNEEGQKELSKALGKFAQKAKNILNSQYNDTKCTIYAGGDDFLGLVNLEYLFEVIEEIKKSFIDKVKTLFPDLTYSTSIIIAHYKSPLNKVLKYSRITLENAKNRFKVAPKAFKTPKNAMSITYITKSNNISTTYFYRDRIEIFSLFVNLLKDKNNPILSPKFIFNLEQEFRKLSLDTIDDITEIDIFIDMINIELKRLIKRASSDFDKEINDKKRELKELYLGLVEFSYDNWSDKDRMFDFENYVQFLKIANAINGEK